MTSPLEQCRELPAQIMNLPSRLSEAIEYSNQYEAAAYAKGHRDARHAAAELADAALAAAEAALAVQPEPVAWAQLGMRNGHTYVRMHYEGHLYPPPPDVQRNLNLVPLYAAPVAVQPLPERFVAFALRDLRADRKRLDGFLALGNEVKRAAEYDEWIAALEAYCAAHGIAPKEPA